MICNQLQHVTTKKTTKSTTKWQRRPNIFKAPPLVSPFIAPGGEILVNRDQLSPGGALTSAHP